MTVWEPVIGLEVHAELKTASKMFCGCPVVDVITSNPNTAVCPVCLGLPGALPVANRHAVELGARAALALNCEVQTRSIFARKNYFYPDLPKGYQISQYEFPLALNGSLEILTSTGKKTIRIRRAHLEEDTGKLTHIHRDHEDFTLVDLNRAGIPLLEIVTEPDLRTIEEARAYAMSLHRILKYMDVSSCDMEKGAIRFEANISIRPAGSTELNTRTEIKNLNSFRTLELALAYEIQRQIEIVENGGRVIQETVGWDDALEVTFSQRSKEEAHDYRYFPEPDLPPLVVDEPWLKRILSEIPENQDDKAKRFKSQYQLTDYDVQVLVDDRLIADLFEKTVALGENLSGKTVANWISGELFSWLKQTGINADQIKITPEMLVELIRQVEQGKINPNTAKQVFGEMFRSGRAADEIIRSQGLVQISDEDVLNKMIADVLNEHPNEVRNYQAGKDNLTNWFFGQVMSRASGQASPTVVRKLLQNQLDRLRTG